jgi:hypothetical protein
MENRLTTSEREEAEQISMSVFGRSSIWSRPEKKGVVEPLKDDNGVQVTHKGIKVSRLVHKTEREALELIRDTNVKFLAFKKKQAEDAVQKSIEEAAKKAALEASGAVVK